MSEGPLTVHLACVHSIPFDDTRAFMSLSLPSSCDAGCPLRNVNPNQPPNRVAEFPRTIRSLGRICMTRHPNSSHLFHFFFGESKNGCPKWEKYFIGNLWSNLWRPTYHTTDWTVNMNIEQWLRRLLAVVGRLHTHWQNVFRRRSASHHVHTHSLHSRMSSVYYHKMFLFAKLVQRRRHDVKPNNDEN